MAVGSKNAVKTNDVDVIKSKQEDLQKLLYSVSEKLYKSAGTQQTQSTSQSDSNVGGPGGATNSDANQSNGNDGLADLIILM